MAQEEIILGTLVPQAWHDRFSDLAKQTGRSLNELVREALAQYIGVTETPSMAFLQLEELRAELTSLRQKVTELEPYKNQIKVLSVRLESVERRLAQQLPATSKAPVSTSQPLPNTSNEDEDFEDEPDEILSDFLPR